MKAACIERHGGIDQVIIKDLPEPHRAEDEVLVEVKAAALNHLDLFVCEGWKGLKLSFPHVLGSDCAGKILEAPADSPFSAGQRVVLCPGRNQVEDAWTKQDLHSVSPHYEIRGENFSGSFTGKVLCKESDIVLLPEHVSYEQAAGAALVGLTAWRMLFRVGEAKEGQSVLIVGAGGGVNLLCGILGKAKGLKVIFASRAEEKLKKLHTLGFEKSISMTAHPEWHREVYALTNGQGVDIVVDNVGPASYEKSLKSLVRGGKLLCCGSTSGPEVSFDNRMIFAKQISLRGSTMGSPKDFRDMFSFLWGRRLEVPIDREFPLAEIHQAFQRLQNAEQFGKIILKP